MAMYGSDAAADSATARRTGHWRNSLHSRHYPYSRGGSRVGRANEMARTVEDVLARRTRASFLNARAAIEMAPRVASLLAHELGYGREWEARQVDSFREVAQNFTLA